MQKSDVSAQDRHSCLFAPIDVSELKTAKGMALADLVTGIYDCLATYKLPAQSRIYLLDQLAQIE